MFILKRTSVIIQQASAQHVKELGALFDIYRKTVAGTGDQQATTLFVENHINNKTSVIFIAQPDHNSLSIYGFINLYPSYSTLALQQLWILNDLYVAEKARGKGIATLLIQHVIEFAAKSGAVRIELKTEVSNHGARKLYEELRFKVDKQHLYYRIPVVKE